MKVIVILPFQYGKNGDELPFSLPFFPVVGCRRSEDVKVASHMTTLHSDVLAESTTQNARPESCPELGRLHRPITSGENKRANLFLIYPLPTDAAANR